MEQDLKGSLNNIIFVLSGKMGVKLPADAEFTPAALFHIKDASIPLWVERTTTDTNVYKTAITAKATTSGNMADGFAAGILCAIEDVAGVNNYMGGIYGSRDGADNTGALNFVVYNAGSQLTGMTLDIAGLSVVGAFGCNAAGAQSPYASGGALAGYVTGAFGLDSDAHMQAFYNLVVAIRAALVANGIMS